MKPIQQLLGSVALGVVSAIIFGYSHGYLTTSATHEVTGLMIMGVIVGVWGMLSGALGLITSFTRLLDSDEENSHG